MPFEITATAEEIATAVNFDGKGKNVIVTGGAGGIGLETSRVFALKGANVIVAARASRQSVVEDLKKSTGNNNISFIELDLESFESIRKFAAQYNQLNIPLHYLILNAGVMATDEGKTKDGFESQFGTNFLGHYLLTRLLLNRLLEAKTSRVVSVSSSASMYSGIRWDDYNFEKGTYDRWLSYGQSKSANILFAQELNRRYKDKGLTANSLHPGRIETGLARHLDISDPDFIPNFIKNTPNALESMQLSKVPIKTAGQGASTTIFAALSPEAEGGKYYNDNHEEVPPEHASKPEDAKRLWELGEKLTGLSA